jgi:hypothetical protein
MAVDDQVSMEIGKHGKMGMGMGTGCLIGESPTTTWSTVPDIQSRQASSTRKVGH